MTITEIIDRRNRLESIRYSFYKLIGHTEKYKTCDDRVPTVHISKGNIKLGEIPSFSLTPGVSCTPEACKTCLVGGCYACKSYRMYNNVRNAWDDNTFLAIMDLARVEKELNQYFDSITAPRFFRVHVAGDFISKKYATMWARVAAAHPHTCFLAFTKQWGKIRGIKFPTNFTIMLSDWPGTTIPGDLRKKYHVAWLNDGSRPTTTFPADSLECPGHCETCGACWNLHKDTVFHKH